MKKKLSGAIVAAALAVSLLAAPSAMAATEVGSNCAANTGGGPATTVQLAKATGDALPLAAPFSGVVTKWKVNSGIAGAFAEQLKVLRPVGPKTFLTVAESTPGTVVQGQNTFATSIPVQAGDRFGVASGPASAVLFCSTPSAGDEMGLVPGVVAVGTQNEYSPIPNLIAAVSATIEPDADNDGFGDETQDKCPRSGAIQQVACPIITLGAFGRVKKGSAQVLVSASSQAQVTVFGTVKVPKQGKKGKARKITIQGGTQSVAPGAVVPFNLIFPPTLKSALANRAPGRSLPLVVTTTTIDAAGQPSSYQLTLKLKGQKKGKGKAKKG